MRARTDWPRFLMVSIIGAILIFVLDTAFHAHLAPRIFAGLYPAPDFPQRAPEESAALIPFLFATYIVQLTLFCYMFLRIYPEGGMGNAVWHGAWVGFFVVIPNMQFFVSLDKFTWTMLEIQVVEGPVLTILLMAFFELAYRPKACAGSLAIAG